MPRSARSPLPPVTAASSSSTSTCRGTPSSATTVSGRRGAAPNGWRSPTPRRAMMRRRWATRRTVPPPRRRPRACRDPEDAAGGAHVVSPLVAPLEAATDPGDDLVGDRPARLGPVLRGGFPVVTRAEEGDRCPGGAAGHRRGRPRPGPCRPGPRTGRRTPSTVTSSTLLPWRGRRRRSRRAPDPRSSPRRRPGVAVGDALALGDLLDQRERGAQPSSPDAGRVSWSAPGAGSRP